LTHLFLFTTLVASLSSAFGFQMRGGTLIDEVQRYKRATGKVKETIHNGTDYCNCECAASCKPVCGVCQCKPCDPCDKTCKNKPATEAPAEPATADTLIPPCATDETPTTDIVSPSDDPGGIITTAEPTTAEPTTAEPTTAEPTTADTLIPPCATEETPATDIVSPSDDPGGIITTAEPTTAEPTTAEPTTAEPPTDPGTPAEPPCDACVDIPVEPPASWTEDPPADPGAPSEFHDCVDIPVEPPASWTEDPPTDPGKPVDPRPAPACACCVGLCSDCPSGGPGKY